MASVNGEPGSPPGSPRPHPVSALPSARARALAFATILVAGACGGLIGSSAVKVGCHGSCGTPEGVDGVVGAVVAAAGVAVIAVLVLRAMGEWRTIKEKREMDAIILAASSAVDGFHVPDDLSGLDDDGEPDEPDGGNEGERPDG